ncbi:MAG: GNAT family N-acetyltransferase [Oscillospiraceae bacterium]|nr:GNAT family N-acetyltransferase [Oscillospiraceae bacterium]
MLDKNVPYAGFYMHRKAGAAIAPFPLPDGYHFAFYEAGDEFNWARIETAVLEFDSEYAALMRFTQDYMPYPEDLKRRCIFIVDSNGERVGSSIAWWRFVNHQRRPWLHWVAVHPAYQGLGLGKALISKIVELMIELEGDVDFYLSTQTWSYKAVDIYKKNGFFPTSEKILYIESNRNYRKAMKIMKALEKERKNN